MKRRRKAEEGPGVDLPIVPMLDMAFQLLFFFVASYHPSALEGQMQLVLPAAGEAKSPSAPDTNAISDTELEPPSDLLLVVRVDAQNKPSNFVVEELGGAGRPQDVHGGPDQLEPQLEAFLRPRVERLKGERQEEVARLAQKEKAQTLTPDEAKSLRHLRTYSIKIKADGRLPYRYIAEAMDACARAGFNSVGFAPPPGLD